MSLREQILTTSQGSSRTERLKWTSRKGAERIRSVLLASSLLAVLGGMVTPAKAYVFTFQDEYWVKNGTALSAAFPGVSGTSTGGVYQLTAPGTVTKLNTDTFTSGFHVSNPLPGEFVQNSTTALLLNGWSSTNFSHAGTTQQINTGGTASGPNLLGGNGAQNVSAAGLGLNFQIVTNATVNAATGVMTGTPTLFDLYSMQLVGSATASGFTIEGLRGGVVVDSQNVSYNFVNGFVTFAPEWYNIDTVAFLNFSGMSLAIRDINTPEPASLAILGMGALGLGLVQRKRSRRAR